MSERSTHNPSRKSRPVARVVDAVRTMEGGGFPVRRPFPTATLDHVDPFLLLDEMGPVDWPPGEAVGAPDHPHRGFETVTYVLDGRHQHKDSRGNQGELGPGDVQWMTAGAGVVHSEMPHPEFRKSGGRSHGFQLWVNLPARDKMMAPRYQEVPAAEIPEGQTPDGRVKARVIAGEALGAKAVIETRTPIYYLHYTVQPGGETEQTIPEDYNAFAYLISGEVRLGPEGVAVSDGQLAEFGPGDTVSIRVDAEATQPADFLLLSGVPIREPIARHGPFVMNTRQELIQAFEDFQSGRMGAIDS